MTIIDYLIDEEKAEKAAKEREIKVSENVIDVLSELYGKPQWLINPKDHQDSVVIVNKWVSELGDYAVEDLKMACNNLFRYKKCVTFPTLSHVLSMLSSTAKMLEKQAAKNCKFTCIERDFFSRDVALGKPFYVIYHYNRAVSYILRSLLLQEIGGYEFSLLEDAAKDKFGNVDSAVLRGLRYRKALGLGLFDYLDDLLRKSKNGGLDND